MHKFAILPLLILLTACAQLGLAPASSFSDRLAYGYGTHTAVIQAATKSLDAREISSAEAEDVLSVADRARQGLDAAKLAYGAGDIQTAEGRLQLAVSLLTELQTHLRRGSK